MRAPTKSEKSARILQISRLGRRLKKGFKRRNLLQTGTLIFDPRPLARAIHRNASDGMTEEKLCAKFWTCLGGRSHNQSIRGINASEMLD